MTVVALLGPTASGKSELALELAAETGAAVVSVDSMQVYREMDIGTAKPTPADRRRVPHYLIDLVDPSETFSVAEFQNIGRRVLDQLAAEHRPVLIVGGSGLHFRALVDPLTFEPTDPAVRSRLEALPPDTAVSRLLDADPDAGAVLDVDNPRRVVRALEVLELTGRTPTQRASSSERRAVQAYRPLIPVRAVGFDPGDLLAERVDLRLAAMMDRGFLDEVRALASRLGPTARQAVGYKQLLPVVAGRRSLEDGVARARRATIGLARKQRTYFRRDPRIEWLPWSVDPSERLAALRRAVAREVAWIS